MSPVSSSLYKHWLICIFSYNRAFLLHNLLDSIAAFYPDMQWAIFDDGSEDPATISLLKELRQQGISVYIHQRNDLSSKHGGLYNLMNVALDYAWNNNFRYAYFVQDDMQFLWRDSTLAQRISAAFARPECLMCNCSFLQKILEAGTAQRLPLQHGFYSFEGNGVADTGIIALDKAKDAQLSFGSHSERSNGQYWYTKGYRMYWLPVPHLAWTPSPRSFRDKEVKGGAGFPLLPLQQKDLARLQHNDSYAYLEDYTSAKDSLLKPYWYTVSPGRLNLIKIYVRYYLRRLSGR